MNQVNIVGAGLAGSILARVLAGRGVRVRVLDDRDEFSASMASSNLYVNSWLKKFAKADARRGCEVLERLFGDSIERPFGSGIARAADVRHVPQRAVLVEPEVVERVMAVAPGGVEAADGKFYEGLTVLCTGHRAAGAFGFWTGGEVAVKVGHAFLFRGELGRPGVLQLRAPYKHEKLYQFDDGLVYYADSTGVTLERYEQDGESLREQTLERARRHVGELPLAGCRVGYRPMMPHHPFGFAGWLADGVWALNGGGKNGMVAYAARADELAGELT